MHRPGNRSSVLGSHKLDGGEKGSRKVETVRASSEGLSKALQTTTKDGAVTIEGLYTPDGSKVGEGGARKGNLEDAIAEANVAKGYRQKQSRAQKRAASSKKSVSQLEDEESNKKADIILENCTDAEQWQFQELFGFFDKNKDSTWGSIEFAQRMTDIGFPTTVEAASNLLFFAGVRNVDRVTYDDFIQLMPKLKAFRQLLEKDAMRCFAAKDVHGKGYISSKATRQILMEMSGPDGMDEEQIIKIIKEADKQRIDRITFDGFVRAVFGTPPLLVYKPRRQGLLRTLCFCGGPAYDDDADHPEVGGRS